MYINAVCVHQQGSRIVSYCAVKSFIRLRKCNQWFRSGNWCFWNSLWNYWLTALRLCLPNFHKQHRCCFWTELILIISSQILIKNNFFETVPYDSSCQWNLYYCSTWQSCENSNKFANDVYVMDQWKYAHKTVYVWKLLMCRHDDVDVQIVSLVDL